MKLNVATLAVVLGGLILFAVASRGMTWTPARIAGISIAAPALVLVVVARVQLGRAFSLRAKASLLVTTGLYSRIRNPIYVFSAMAIVGFIIFAGQLWWLLAFAAILPIQVFRGRNEARVLEEEFGDAYREYRQRTWF